VLKCLITWIYKLIKQEEKFKYPDSLARKFSAPLQLMNLLVLGQDPQANTVLLRSSSCHMEMTNVLPAICFKKAN